MSMMADSISSLSRNIGYYFVIIPSKIENDSSEIIIRTYSYKKSEITIMNVFDNLSVNHWYLTKVK